MTEDFDVRVRQALTSVRRNRIFERIREVIEHFDGMECEDGKDHLRYKGRLEMTIAGGIVALDYFTYGQFHEYSQAMVHYGGRLVFQANRSGESTDLKATDPRRVIRGRGYVMVVDRYTPASG